jgi:vacuolar-type H+-ATPase subunit I/STV1
VRLEIYSVIALVIFGILVFLLSAGISGRMFSLGFPFLIAGIPYFFMNPLKQKTLSLIPAQAAAGGATVVDAILKSLADKFFLMFLVGFVLVVAGIITRFVFRKK